MKQYKVLQWAFSFLEKYNREEKVAEILLQHITEQSSASFYANMQEAIAEDARARFIEMVKDHAINGTPVQHMIGTAAFYGRDFFVNEKVLIPRFETEEVVFHAIEEIKRTTCQEQITVVDLGTGSGVIAITLALELPQLVVYASDISEYALQNSQKNARKYDANINFFQGDFLQPMIDKGLNPEVIISNPPYIAERERHLLTDTVENFDPDLALFAENEGLAAYEKIVHQVAELPRLEGRLLIFEIGYEQAAAVTAIIERVFPQSEVTVRQDINGKNRIVSAIL